MQLQIVKLDPNRNITLLVTSRVPRDMQAAIAAHLMSGDNLSVLEYCADADATLNIKASSSTLLQDVEQVGFVEEATLPGVLARLQMMGGEFCGNASMALAALLATQNDMRSGTDTQLDLEVSGATLAVHCKLRRLDAAHFSGSVTMPLPETIGEACLPGGFRVPQVRFPGIAHLIIPDGLLSDHEAETLIPELCRQLNADALGMLFIDAEATVMRPLVYVRDTGSCVWEHGCGSGTAALGAWRASQAGTALDLNVSQPGGAIAVHTKCHDEIITELEIDGRISIVSAGMVYTDI